MGEKIFTAALIGLVTVSMFFIPEALITVPTILALKLAYVGALLGTTFGLLHFMRGTKTDVLAKIFDEDKLAVAVFVGAVIISIALVIGK